MRYFSESGYDGIRNLLNSIKACLLPIPPQAGVALLMTDRLFAAREVIKINALNIDAFDAPESGPIGYVAGEDVLLTRCRFDQLEISRPVIATNAIEPNVPLLACYTGMDGAIVEHLREQKIAGLVVEGFGAGNVPPGIVPALEKLLQDGIPVVLTTQCPQGGVWPIYAYPGGAADLQKKGVILGGRLSGAKARIQLMVALGAKLSYERLKELYQ